jgi:hypothetical protein
MLNVCMENQLANYMIYKNIQRSFSLALLKKVIISKPQSRTKSAII